MPQNELSCKDFRESGALQEVNRAFFHPRGLALAAIFDDGGCEKGNRFLILDYTDAPEGLIFDPEIDLREKAELNESLMQERFAQREDILGYRIQPLGSPVSTAQPTHLRFWVTWVIPEAALRPAKELNRTRILGRWTTATGEQGFSQCAFLQIPVSDGDQAEALLKLAQEYWPELKALKHIQKVDPGWRPSNRFPTDQILEQWIDRDA